MSTNSFNNTAFVVTLYDGILGRQFEQSGLANWLSALNGGMTRYNVVSSFLNSEEFINQGLSNELFVTRLYERILDRQPDIGGYNFWVSVLNYGAATKEDVVFGFLNSAEFQKKLLTDSIQEGTQCNDYFQASDGSDMYFGNLGFDTIDYSAIEGGITLESQGKILKQFQAKRDQIFDIEQIIAPNDIKATNIIDGSGGNGQTSFNVDLSQDSLTVQNIPGIGNQTFTVKNFNHVTGTLNNDVIIGNAQSNSLTGGGGNDFLTGGSGADKFIFTSVNDGVDTITDFAWKEGDKIVVNFGSSLNQFKAYYNQLSRSSDLVFLDTKLATLTNLNSASDFIPSLDIIIA
jgi:Ca2+-binding RTX toxin-like protein